ncbi:MAG TPA: PAS domain S-box protein [Acidimicrobiales bacterium]|nr:PAS domain S-box protein [Acidimicrobiales bacterium]
MNEDSGLLQDMLEASPDAVVVVGEAGLIELATSALETLFGYEPQEMIGQPVELLIPDHRRAAHVANRTEYLTTPEVRPMGLGLDLMGRRKDGSIFPVDVSLVPRRMDGSLKVGAFVRDATERRRGEDLLRFVNEISRNALAGGDTSELLTLAAARARSLVVASLAWVAVLGHSGDEIVVAAADGDAAEGVLGASVAASGSLAAQAMMAGSTVRVTDMSTNNAVIEQARHAELGPGLYLPMLAEEGPVGALVVARPAGSSEFSATEISTAEVFASAAAIVLALGSARRALEEGMITAEHERIARDLHDTVIQRLFALGMRLQAAERLAQGPVAERIRDTVDAIDEVIREIRETIFDLNRPDFDAPHLRQRVRQAAAQSSQELGFAPRIAFRGPVEAAVDEALASDLLAVLSEALSNVVKHAKASSVDVVVAVADGHLVLSVSDDGVGVFDGPTAGNGTANMAARAARFGGDFALNRRTPAGTILQWRVPHSH